VKQIANRRENAGGNYLAVFSRMEKLYQKSGCAAVFGNTEVKKSLPHISVAKIALHRYWKSNLKLTVQGVLELVGVQDQVLQSAYVRQSQG
jgi:hypothetical protein